MNCTDFNALLHEFLDGSLPASIHEAVQKHLDECGDCRRALTREQAFAKSIRQSFDRALAGISPQPGMRRNVIALSSKSAPPVGWKERWRNLISSLARPARASAAILCLLILFGGIHIFRRTTPATKITAEASQYSRIIDVPIPVQTHVFQYENGTVVDAIVTRMAIGHAGIFENKKPSLKPSPKTL